jgi:hypothetical protein
VPFEEAMGRSDSSGSGKAMADTGDNDDRGSDSEVDEGKAKAAEAWQRRETEAELQEVAALAVPRRIEAKRHCNPKAEITLAASGIAYVMLIAGTKSTGRYHGNPLGPPVAWPMLMVFAAAGLLYLINLVWKFMKGRWLVAKGAVALGTIVDSKRWVRRAHVTCTFADSVGRTFTSRGEDFSASLRPGMCVMVFYDALNPKRNTPDCGLEYRVEMAGEGAKRVPTG